MPWVAAVAALALIEYLVFSLLVGLSRGRFKVDAPAVSGHPEFERYFRAHQNTMEQLVVFLPALFLFATWVSDFWAALLGLVFVAGRAIYFRSYVAEPASRGAGFLIWYAATVTLVVGSAIGAVVAAI